MAKTNLTNPRVHIICGMCGNKNEIKFKISMENDGDSGEDEIRVNLICNNCSTLTGLDEIIENEIGS